LIHRFKALWFQPLRNYIVKTRFQILLFQIGQLVHGYVMGFKTTIVVGGTNMSEQRSDLRQGVEVCVATPVGGSTR
jgi:hypothetical protein